MKVLVVDDEPAVLDLLKNLLELEGIQVTTAGSGREALNAIREERFDSALVDIYLPDLNGVLLFQEIRNRYPSLARKVLFISGLDLSEGTAGIIGSMGAGFLAKPVDQADLVRLLQKVTGGS